VQPEMLIKPLLHNILMNSSMILNWLILSWAILQPAARLIKKSAFT